jgi:hypothetical protein
MASPVNPAAVQMRRVRGVLDVLEETPAGEASLLPEIQIS